jgi:hypothetical protein
MSVAIPVVQTWDGLNRRIYLKSGVTTFHWVDDIYAEYIHQRRVDEAFRSWMPLLRADGNNPKGGGKFTPRYVTLLLGTRVVPFNENTLINVLGEAITDNADIDPDVFDTTTRTQPIKLYIEPPAAEIVRATQELAAIARLAYSDMVHVDILSPYSYANPPPGAGPDYLGTPTYPVNNITDALTIAVLQGIKAFHLHGNITLGADALLDGYRLVGFNAIRTRITILPEAQVINCEITDATVTGTLDGGTIIREGVIDGLEFLNGFVHKCAITPAPIVLGGNAPSLIMESYMFGDQTQTITIDFNHTMSTFLGMAIHGSITIKNMTQPTYARCGFASGGVTGHSSCTAGTINAAGVVNKFVNNTTGTCAMTMTSIKNLDAPTITAAVPTVAEIVAGLPQSSGGLTAEQNTQLMNALTTGKFLALK